MTVWRWIIVSVFGLLMLFIVVKTIIEIMWNHRLNRFKANEQVIKEKVPINRLAKYAYSFVLSAAVVVVIAAFGTFNLTESLSIDKELVHANRVGSEAQLNRLIDSYHSTDYYYNYEIPSLEDSADSPELTNEETRDYTDTNIQVEGVDEGDVLKTDSYRVFYAPRYYNVIEVLDIEDDHTMTQVESMIIDDFRIDSLYLTDEYLIVIGYRYEEMIYPMDTLEDYWGFWFYEQTATVTVFDKESLDEVYRLETDLSFIDHRLIDDTLYIVSMKYFYEDQELRPEFDTTIEGSTTISYLSYMDMYYFDDVPASSMTVITSLDLTTFEQRSQGFIGQTSQIYVTEHAIYSYFTNYEYIETDLGIEVVVKTNIIKYRIDKEDHSIKYVAATWINGIVEDRYWMDESGDYLRVVTSRSSWWDNGENTLYILKENTETDTFDQIAVMDENIGHENDHVESVRFHKADDYDYVNIVTYERIDPLYTIDLADPEHPTIIGIIEEPGYSEYIHDWGSANQAIGLGYLDTNEDGMVDGMKLSAYDTSTDTILDTDPYPYEDDLGWSYSYTDAMHNPKALMVDVELGLFGFPIVSYHYSMDDEHYYYQTSFMVYQIDFNSDDVLGEPIIIEHESVDWYNRIDRGVYIEGYIYTFSAHGIKSYDLENKTSFEEILINYEIES